MLTLNQVFFRCPCSASEEMHKKLRGRMARTADLKWPSGYSIPYICSVYKLGQVGHEGLITAQAWAVHQSAGGEQLY